MSIAIPTKPNDFNEDPDSKTYGADLMKYQQKLAEYNQAIQAAENSQNQEAETASNMQKANNDAMQGIIRNIA